MNITATKKSAGLDINFSGYINCRKGKFKATTVISPPIIREIVVEIAASYLAFRTILLKRASIIAAIMIEIARKNLAAIYVPGIYMDKSTPIFLNNLSKPNNP